MIDWEKIIGHRHHFVPLGHGCNCGEGTKELKGILGLQRTQLLKEVKERIGGICLNHTKDIKIRIGSGGCEGCQAIQNALKKLKELEN